MTTEYASRYATALLRGNGLRESFEIAFPHRLETQLVAEALEALGCNVEWSRFRHFAVVHPPAEVAVLTDREAIGAKASEK